MTNEKPVYRCLTAAPHRWRLGVAGLSFVICLFSCFYAAAQVQSGKASYYSKKMTGARTANGERLHHDSMTCAHKTLPFGTMLRVTNLSNGKQVVVRVTDRGPYRKGRIIDLSWGAAKAIGMLSQGITAVRVEKLNATNVPFKPEEEEVELPLIDFEIAEIADGVVPIWQSEPKIDRKRAEQEMEKTAGENAARPIVYGPAKTDAIEQINRQPNQSRAFQKRQSQPTAGQ